MINNAYIHIPFCKSRCKYCSFISYTKLELKNQYLNALISEIKNFYKNELLNTLYFGGGTPSNLAFEEFKQLTDLFKTDADTEITAELNPESITLDYLQNLKSVGINRLSFGCQTFDDGILKYIGRRHSAKDVENSIKNAKLVDFKNISLDFIYGLPNQTIKMFEDDLYRALDLDVQHISLYGLKIDENCYFAKYPPENLPDEDMQADMYLKAIEVLKKNGFEHYEISNFSKKGFNSRHNLNYWDNNSYYGFGCGAHGYVHGERYFNSTDLEEYINNNKRTSHKLSMQEQLEEEIFLGLRKGAGIDIENINKKFGIDFCSKYAYILEKYSDYLSKTPKGFKFTDEGILLSNVILSEFLQ